MDLPLRLSTASFLTFSLALSTPAFALMQDAAVDSHHDRLWVSVGAGIGRTAPRHEDFSWELSAGAGLTYQPSWLLIGVHADAVWSIYPGDLIAETAVLVGVGSRGTSGHASIAIGPALVGGDLNVFRTEPNHFSSALGLAVQAQVLGVPLPFVGGGMTGFLNLNPRQSFGGIRFTVVFGQLR